MPHDLDASIKAHKPHPKSLVDEESKEAYNEEDARQAFGDEFIDRLKKDQSNFKGDWWQLALLVRHLEENKQNPQIEDEDRLGAWNKWRVEQRNALGTPAYEEIHLEDAGLLRAHLEHADLSGAHLEHAWLLGAHLEHADLGGANLEHADMRFAGLEHADLDNAHLKHAYLRAARLKHVSLAEANLEHVLLDWAHLEHAYLAEANLEHADLSYAYLEHADLNKADLRGARLSEANLEHSDVRGATGLLFDGNRVEGIHIEGNAPDPWSVLRRQYTGPWFFVHLLLLAIFFAPFVGHALYLTAKSQFQEWSMEQYNALGARARSAGAERVSRGATAAVLGGARKAPGRLGSAGSAQGLPARRARGHRRVVQRRARVPHSASQPLARRRGAIAYHAAME